SSPDPSPRVSSDPKTGRRSNLCPSRCPDCRPVSERHSWLLAGGWGRRPRRGKDLRVRGPRLSDYYFGRLQLAGHSLATYRRDTDRPAIGWLLSAGNGSGIGSRVHPSQPSLHQHPAQEKLRGKISGTRCKWAAQRFSKKLVDAFFHQGDARVHGWNWTCRSWKPE